VVSLSVNGKTYQVDVEPDVPLLWVIRDYLKLTGTKFGCGVGICGTCTIHVDGKADRSCQLTAGDVQGKNVTTIEGLPKNHPLMQAWVEKQVPQCGYCQPGQIMQAASLLHENPSPTDEEIKDFMSDNLCRCGTYPRIVQAIKRASREAR
jgi:isoquinoline 1-oxidoreductase alpha subunit